LLERIGVGVGVGVGVGATKLTLAKNESDTVAVEEGRSATVELRQPGYATVRRADQWDTGSVQYPVSTNTPELPDRRVAVTAALPGAEVFTGDTNRGDEVADVVVPMAGAPPFACRRRDGSGERESPKRLGRPDR